ncbi:MAG: hypothetical protein GXO97_10155 [Nitrospirae bacterium]|nr:hypothetical protein [Nitrospirota bacterium]
MKDLYKEIKTGLPGQIYYIYGKDQFFITEAIKEIKGLIPPGERDINLLVFDFDRVIESPPSIDEIFELLNTPGFFGSSRYIVLKNLHLAKKTDTDRLSKHLSQFQSSTNQHLTNKLIMLSMKPPIQSLRKMIGEENIFTTDKKPPQLKNWIKKLAKDRDIIITNRAIDLLVSLSGGEGGTIYSEMEKVSLMDKKEVDVQDIYSIMYGSMEGNIFALTEAIVEGNKKRAFTLLSMIESEPYSILGAINWKFKEMEKKYKRNYSKAFENLLQSDIKIKTSSADYPLEELIFRLLQI